MATVHAAMDAGVALIDTAPAYTRIGVESYAEQIVAQALRGLTGEQPLIATKGGHWRDGDSFPVDGRPVTLRARCEISLRALGADRIGLYQRWPARGAASPIWRTHPSTGHQAGRPKPRAASPGGARRVGTPDPAGMAAGSVTEHRPARRCHQACLDYRLRGLAGPRRQGPGGLARRLLAYLI